MKDLNLSVRQGEFLTMLGPSGSGKTTTLMMLAGFERPTLGHILLDGKPVERLPPEKRNIGMVFQNYALFPHMTVAENVAFPLRYRGIRAPRPRRTQVASAPWTMVQSGRTSADRQPAQLSGGQQQRVALARALVFEPSLVLMDEPLGALDKQLREHMQIEIKQLQTALGITIVYVTHDQSEALTMSDRIAVFHDGVIQQLADRKRSTTAPENRFVAGFIGENNTLPATCRQEGESPWCRMARRHAADGCHRRSRRTMAGPAAYRSARKDGARQRGADSPTQLSSRRQVREAFFLGDHMRLIGRSALGGQLSPRAFRLRQARSFAPGDTVRLACNVVRLPSAGG